MNIALYGATGKSGTDLLTELLSRGHKVTAIVRDPAKLPARPGLPAEPELKVKQGTLDSAEAITSALGTTPYDAVVSAYGPPATPDGVREVVSVTQHFIEAFPKTAAKRFLYTGGAGSLFVAPGVTLIASGYLPAEWLGIAIAHADALDLLKQSTINWTCFSPAGFFEPGPRTGKFRIGKDDLITDAQGNSKISYADGAIAIVDEFETPHYERARFTAAY